MPSSSTTGLKRICIGDYLDSNHVTSHIQRVMKILVETRCLNPQELMAEYFAHVVTGGPQPIALRSYIVNERYNHENCMDFFASVYRDATVDPETKTAKDFSRSNFMEWVRSVCENIPGPYKSRLYELIDPARHAGSSISFQYFVSAIRVCVLFQESLVQLKNIISNTENSDPESIDLQLICGSETVILEKLLCLLYRTEGKYQSLQRIQDFLFEKVVLVHLK